MKIETKPVITFTDKEYRAFNDVCMMLDDIINGGCSDAFESIAGDEVNPDIFYDTFATITNYVERHRE